MFEVLNRVRESWKSSQFVLLFDDVNEIEKTSMVLPSILVRPYHLKTIREKSGGKIFVPIGDQIARKLELPALKTVFLGIASRYRVISNLQYNSELLFKNNEVSISITHQETETGLTDSDQALTISSLGELIEKDKLENLNKNDLIDHFCNNYYTPGHVPLVRAKLNLLKGGLSTTELTLALAEICHQVPTTLFVDLLDDKGEFMSREEARSFAKSNKLTMIEASNVIKLWRSINKVPKNKIASPQRKSGLV